MSPRFFIVRSGAMTDAVVDASGPTQAMVKAILRFRPGHLANGISVRESGVPADDSREQIFQTSVVLATAAATKWYNPAPDGNGFIYAGAPRAWE